MAGASYDYLLSMPLSSLTLEKVEALKKVRGGVWGLGIGIGSSQHIGRAGSAAGLVAM